jgi:hypothetical protein
VLAGLRESVRKQPAKIPIHYGHVPGGHPVQPVPAFFPAVRLESAQA